MEFKRIDESITECKLGNSKNKSFIEQLKFFGATPVKESKNYTYFRFNGDFNKTARMLGFRI